MGLPAEPAPSSMAFFDVDETLLSVKSMVEFYDFVLNETCETAEEVHRRRDAAREVLGRGSMPREIRNSLFYRRFVGYDVARVAALGRRWFDTALARGDLFHADVVAALHAHRRVGTTTVLLSGSFPPCLDPVRSYVGADLAVSTQLEARAGTYTGEVVRPMIGEAKVEAARAMIEHAGLAAADCHAYGDHTSDLGLLQLVGHPVVVGSDPELVSIAEAEGWPRLRGTPGPVPNAVAV